MDKSSEGVYGVSFKKWEAAFRPGLPEFSSSNFLFTRENDGQVRIAFANSGPYINADGERAPVYTHAVNIQPSLAIELARNILKHYASPKDDNLISSKQI